MRKDAIRVGLACGVISAAFLLAAPRPGHGQDAPATEGSKQLQVEEQGESRRESEIMVAPPNGDAPLIGFIDSPTATCYQPDPAQDVCYVNWYYLAVDANPNYMIWMQAELNAIGKVARYQGFFQTSMYAPYNMHGKGFKVACGALGAGGDPELGNAYAYTIRARDSADLGSANYGTVYCPAFTP